MSDVIHLSDDPLVARTPFHQRSRTRRALTIATLAGLITASGCGGGESGDQSVSSAPTTSALDGSALGPGEILLEPIGIPTAQRFAPSVVVGEEAVPVFMQTEMLLSPSATGDTGPAPTVTAAPTGQTPPAGGTAPATDQAPLVTAADQVALVQATGNLPGLYGGTRDMAACDQLQLVDYLEANPDKAAAWAAVQGIEPAEIRSFVDELTPLVLLHDTRVTNHGFVDGAARPHQSVLQAGHAVLVDRFGVPRAKCSCGNPLAPPVPAATAPTYVGTPWPDFDRSTIVVVVPDQPVDSFEVIDLETGNLIAVSTGRSAPVLEDNSPEAADLLGIYDCGPTTVGPVGGPFEEARRYIRLTAEGEMYATSASLTDGLDVAVGRLQPSWEIKVVGPYVIDGSSFSGSTFQEATGVANTYVGVVLADGAIEMTEPFAGTCTLVSGEGAPATAPPATGTTPSDWSPADAAGEILDQLLLECGITYDPTFVDGGGDLNGWRWLVDSPDWTADFSVGFVDGGGWSVQPNNDQARQITEQCGFNDVG